MAEIIDRREVGRCQEHDPVTGVQCHEPDDHLGPHSAGIADDRMLLWPSADCIEAARVEAEIDAMSDEEIHDSLVAAGGADHLEQWKSGTMAFVRGAIAHRKALEAAERERDEARAERDRLAAQLHVYDANHGEHCDAELERYATIAESACRVIADARDRLDCILTHDIDDGREEYAERLMNDLSTFLSLPSYEVPGLRAQVAARDAALEACQRRIAELLGNVGKLEARRDELLALVARISQETPLPAEIEGWESQRAALVAEVGTLRARVTEAERHRDAARESHQWEMRARAACLTEMERWWRVRDQWRQHDYVGLLGWISEDIADSDHSEIAKLFRAINDAVEGNQPGVPATTVTTTDFDMPLSEPVAERCVVADGAHEIAFVDLRFSDDTVATYVRVREFHTQPPIERWFAMSTLVHLALNVGSPEVWQIGNRDAHPEPRKESP